MKLFPLLIHTHFHNRLTGVTRSIENVFPYLENQSEAYIFGYGIEGRKISFGKLLKLVLSKRYFVMHCHRNNEIILALLLRLLGGNFKLISTRHAKTPPSSFTNYLFKKSDLIVALTKSMSQSLPFKAEVVGHGVDTKLFKSKSSVVRPEIKQKNILTCAGRVREAKGQKVLLETIAPFLKQYPDWALAIIGKVDKPKFLKELKEIVANHSAEDQVYFIEETPEIISFYQASHSVIVPSFTEGFSLVCAEAMSCGCNVLASKGVGIHSEIITHGKNGYLFNIHNPAEMKALLIKLVEGELAHLGDKARKEVEANWSSETEANKLMELYDSQS
ncbi:MAG: glycosyltransferase family 4 protein [Bacteroidota bacterium]